MPAVQSVRTVSVATEGGNNLLKALRPSDYALLAPHIEVSEAQAGELLYSPGDDVGTVHFPCGPSLASFLVCNEDGRDVETILIGREGAVGGIVSLGHLPAYCRIVVKFGGPFLRLPVRQLQAAKLNSPSLRSLFARYADCLLAQILQSTACNAIHSIEQRTAKWIVAAMDRTGNHLVPLTHEELASMLGVGRSYTSRVIQTFKLEGILETRRGSLIVRDPEALMARSCMCNVSVKRHFEEVLRGVYPSEKKNPRSCLAGRAPEEVIFGIPQLRWRLRGSRIRGGLVVFLPAIKHNPPGLELRVMNTRIKRPGRRRFFGAPGVDFSEQCAAGVHSSRVPIGMSVDVKGRTHLRPRTED